MNNHVTEQDGILLPWQPESHKPALPFVICTYGKGDYWLGRYHWDNGVWLMSMTEGGEDFIDRAGNLFLTCEKDELPLAWIEPEKFVSFVKKKKLHLCQSPCGKYRCFTGDDQEIYLDAEKNLCIKVYACPFCGFKAGEK